MTVDETYAREHPAVKPGAYAVLEVSDSGAAVNDHSHHTPNRSNPHALADLSPIAATIRQFGGHLWAASEFGRGATFRIFLPQA
jgi:hypothetical protein